MCVGHCDGHADAWSTIQPLQRVMNAASRVIMNLSVCDHVKPALKSYIGYHRAKNNVQTLLMRLIHIEQAAQYLTDCVSAAVSRYRLTSTDTANYVLPRTRTKFGEHGFSYCGPAAWISPAPDLHNVADTDPLKTADE